jgi:hypothetical protein
VRLSGRRCTFKLENPGASGTSRLVKVVHIQLGTSNQGCSEDFLLGSGDCREAAGSTSSHWLTNG